jgi:hypothetical protein
MVLALVLLNLAGGDCVEDIKVLEADDGFCEHYLINRPDYRRAGQHRIRNNPTPP